MYTFFFRFNKAFDKETKQDDIFEHVARGVIDKYVDHIDSIGCREYPDSHYERESGVGLGGQWNPVV
jgi:hypothetical protein